MRQVSDMLLLLTENNLGLAVQSIFSLTKLFTKISYSILLYIVQKFYIQFYEKTEVALQCKPTNIFSSENKSAY